MLYPKISMGIAALACCSLMLCAAAAAPQKKAQPQQTPEIQAEPTPVEESAPTEDADEIVQEDRGPWEVTDRVELIFREKIAAAGDKTLAAKVVLKNKSDVDIAGKLVLVIDGSSIEGICLHEPQGRFTETTPYLQMIPVKRKLDAGDETPVKSLILTSTDSTAGMELETASLRWRAYTLTKPADLESDSTEDDKPVPGKGYTWGEMRKVMAVQSAATVNLVEKHDGAILGTGTSEDANGKLIIRVYAARGGMSKRIPGSIDGVPVELTVTGTIKGGPAFSRVTYDQGQASVPLTPEAETTSQPENLPTASKAVSPSTSKPLGTVQVGPTTRRFTRPVPIGISSFNQSTPACATGTLGCRCIGRDGKQYALSNCHVYGEVNEATIGDLICQPGQLDSICAINALDVIGKLSAFQRIQFFTDIKTLGTAPINFMDGAIAVCPAGMLDVCTPKEGYGTPSRYPQESLFVGMPVQKHGRTTSFTKGKIFALNVEAVINYDEPGLARFQNCIDVQTQSRLPGFGGPGDSGSLVVTVSDRRPVGLLFAGGGFNTFLNPISPVLVRFKVGVDDGTGGVPILGSGRMGSATGPVKQHKNILVPLSK